jgi:6-pyruvoyltetrahydropterin/6-carboxytetrahydropterin synthase
MQRIAWITCEFNFEASHQLWRDDWSAEQNEAVFGNCSRLHGHSYRLLVALRGPVDPETGMVRNFRDVKRVVRERVVQRLDHHHINDIVDGISTAETMCYWMAEQLLPEFDAALVRIDLWETRTSHASLTEAELQTLLEERPRPLIA